MDLEPLVPEPDPFAPATTQSEVHPARRSRRLMAGAVAAVTLVGGGWAAGAAIGTSASGSTAANATGSTGAAQATPCPPLPRQRPLGIGKVATVAAPTFTVTNPGETSTVHTNGTTKFTKVTTGAVSDAASGTRVIAHGTANLDGSITAAQLVLLPALPSGQTPKPQPATKPRTGATPARRLGPAGLASGTVATNSNGTLTITSAAGKTVTIDTTSKTVVVETVPATISDVSIGEMVAASGPAATDGSITARQVRIVDTSLGALGSLAPRGAFAFPGLPGRRGPGFGVKRPMIGTPNHAGPSTTTPTTIKGKAPTNGTVTPGRHRAVFGHGFARCGAPRTPGASGPSGPSGPSGATTPRPNPAGFDSSGQGGFTTF
jgi:hypothetical protein